MIGGLLFFNLLFGFWIIFFEFVMFLWYCLYWFIFFFGSYNDYIVRMCVYVNNYRYLNKNDNDIIDLVLVFYCLLMICK